MAEIHEQEIAFQILSKNDDFCVVHKPEGICIDGEEPVTLEKLTAEKLSQLGQSPKLYLCHQLDRGTSGILLYGLNSNAAKRAGKAFTSRNVRKIYLAIVCGHIHTNESFIIDHGQRDDNLWCMPDTADNPGRPCVTEARCVWTGTYRGHPVSKLEVTLHTGRRHQIRVHLAQLGFPIVGDKEYCPIDFPANERMHLHNFRLVIPSLELDASTIDPFAHCGPPNLSPSEPFLFFPPKRQPMPTKGAVLITTMRDGDLHILLHKTSRQDLHRMRKLKGNIWTLSSESKFQEGNCDILDSALRKLPTSDVLPSFKRKRLSTLNNSLTEPVDLPRSCFHPPAKRRKIEKAADFLTNEVGSHIRMGGVENIAVDSLPFLCVYVTLISTQNATLPKDYQWFPFSTTDWTSREYDPFLPQIFETPTALRMFEHWKAGNFPEQSSGYKDGFNVVQIKLPELPKKPRHSKKRRNPGPFQVLENLPLFWSGVDVRKDAEKMKQFDLIVDLSGVESLPHLDSTEIIAFKILDSNSATLFPVIQEALPKMKEFLEQNRGVLVHCEIGRSRSVSLVAAYLMWAGKHPLDTIFQKCSKQTRIQLSGRFKFELSLLEERWLGNPSWIMPQKLMNRLARSIDVSTVHVPRDFTL